MPKKILIGMFLPVLLSLLILPGCAQNEPVTTPYRTAGAMSTEEALDLFDELYPEAERVYNCVKYPDLMEIGEDITVDGIQWREVLDYPNAAALQQEIDTYFHTYLVGLDSYFTPRGISTVPKYMDIDGRLYYNPATMVGGGFESDILMETLRVVVLEENRIEYEIDLEAMGEPNGYLLYELMTYEKDAWKFSVYQRSVSEPVP